MRPDNSSRAIALSKDRTAVVPTAGLHFTAELLQTLSDNGIQIAHVELVVGLDTFQPIQVENPLDHKMHTEF